MSTAYVDASAMVKLILDEPDSPAMFRWYTENPRVLMSRVGVIETRRAANRGWHDPAHLRHVLDTVGVIELDLAVAQSAALIGTPSLRTLDAIHLASAVQVASDLDAFVTYDDRLAEAARNLGLPVVRPG